MNDMKKIQECLGPELDEMNAIIVETLRTSNQMMDDIVTRYLKIKGKQIRPILVILSARMFGSVSREAHPTFMIGSFVELQAIVKE